MSEPHRIGGRYEVGELLGRGGMAEVRKGTDVRLGRTVAIKRLRAKLDGPFDTKLLQTIRGMGYVLESRSVS